MRLLKVLLVSSLLAALIPAGMLGYAYWTYKSLEKSVIEKMDQYYLTITSPGHEEYLLAGDEVFEVPYMASTLSVDAQPTRIYDASDRLIGEFASEKGVYVTDPEDLPPFLKKALVATEDNTFYQHHGVNYKAIARATMVNLRNLRKSQGGSTLTQQLAKMMFTTRKKTFGRKVFELLCARKLESKFTKDQIILMYLNFVYFGHGSFGVESAAQYYFGKPARRLELDEAALLVGIIASPNRYSPYDRPDLAKARHHTVLARMAKNDFISTAAAERYWREFWKVPEDRLKRPESSFWRMRVNKSPYLNEVVRRALLAAYRKEKVMKGGLKVRTTFDLEVQKAAEAAMRAGLREENRSTMTARLEGGLAAVRPRDGAILALVGGSGFNFQNQLNRASDISRPMGSTVKPFLYAWAFESGRFKRSDVLLDAPLHFKQGGKIWSPQNYGKKYFGEVTLETALQKSLNAAAIKLLQGLDLDAVRGLLSDATGSPREAFPRDLSLALGTADLSPLKAAAAYSIFANGGKVVKPYFIRRIEDRDGVVLVDAETPPAEAPKVILSSATCATMIAVMQGVLGPEGSAGPAAKRTGFSLPAAGKTGTTNDYRDAWFSGVTPDLSASVWVGHDDMRVALGFGETGGRLAAPIWMNFVKEVYRNRPTRAFDAGPDIR